MAKNNSRWTVFSIGQDIQAWLKAAPLVVVQHQIMPVPILWLQERLDAIDQLLALCSELQDYFMEALNQGCGRYNKEKDIMEYDHMCLSTYEGMVAFALERGWIKPEQVTR